MKKNFMKIKDFANLATIKRKINDAFSEKGQEAADALKALITELENSEVEIDEVAFAEEVKKLIASYEEVPAAVANAIAAKMKAIQNAIPAGEKVTVKVKNEIAGAVLRAQNRNEVKNAVEAVLVKNDVTGLSFNEVIDFAIATKWEDLNPILSLLGKTMYNKFFYSEDEMATAATLAKQWDKTGETEKLIQEVAVLGKTISTKYVYKRQQMANEDLVAIEKAGGLAGFLAWINNELDKQIANTIVMAILVGDTVNAAGSRVTTFETIGTKAATDIFTAVKNPAVAATPALADLRKTADAVLNPTGAKKIGIISQSLLTALSTMVYATGGTPIYRTKEEMTGQIGVDELLVTDILAANSAIDVHFIAMIPSGYWVKEDDSIDVVYPTWEKNVQNYQKERMVGGAIHDLYSTAVLKEASQG